MQTHQERWQAWLESIKNEVLTAYLWRATWLTVGDIVRDNATIPPSHYFRYLADTYGAAQASAVRRLTDERRDVVSLARLIKDLRRHAPNVTAEWYANHRPEAERRDFRPFQLENTEHFDPAIADADLVKLRSAVARVKGFVDEHVAHQAEEATKDIPTFREIHEALDSVGEIFRRYHSLLTAAEMPFLVPYPQPGWHLALSVPWVRPGSQAPKLRGTPGGRAL